ncbi:MAG: glycosyltransferase family 2 protein [Chitinophagaceae bacterium]
MTAQPLVAIVILNWNGKSYLQKFLPSVLSTRYSNYKIIVADNASTDDSVLFLKNNFPTIEIIALEKNFGFAKGYNEALSRVQADYYALLNSDLEVTQNWLQSIIDLLEKDELYAACQPKILNYNQKNEFEYGGAAGGWLDSYGYPFTRGRIFDICEEDKGQYNTIEEIFWATGAALVIKSKMYNQLQGFDEFFFAHQEEIDLCWRLQLEGYKIFCCPQSIVYHVGGGTLPKGNYRKTFLNFRNNHIMMAKNLPWREKWWKIPFRLALDQISAVKGLLGGNLDYFRAIIRAHLAFIGWILFQKKRYQKIKKMPINKLSGVYRGNIVWQYFVKKKTIFSDIIMQKKELTF